MKKFFRVLVFGVIVFFIFFNYDRQDKQANSQAFEVSKENVDYSFTSSPPHEDYGGNISVADSKLDTGSDSGSDINLTANRLAINKLDAEKEAYIRNKFNIDNGVIGQLNIYPQFIGNLSAEDVVSFSKENGFPGAEVKITRVSTENNITTVVGVIEGLDVGYGVTLTYGDNILVGDLISESGHWSIDTISNTTFITNGLKSEGHTPNDAL